MKEPWDILDQPDADTMLAEIEQRDTEAAALARQVWAQLRTRPETEREWLDTLANAILSYRREDRSRIKTIAQNRLETLQQRGF
jgi:parvulin-like peptidyl-prolyl isomerase